MGRVDLDFKPSVPVFDANVALGRRHDRRVKVHSVPATLREMDRSGIQRALVYSPDAAFRDSREGNRLLYDSIQGEPRLFAQFAFNPSSDRLDEFATVVDELQVRSVRTVPSLHSA